MGIGGISIWQLLIILVIVALIFGTKKLRGIGGDLGGAVKGFKKAISDDDDSNADKKESEEGAEEETVAADADAAENKTNS